MANDVVVPRSRIALTYDTTQPDQPRVEKELPFRLLVVGNLTGRSENQQQGANAQAAPTDELDDRAIHNLNGKNLDLVMSKMNISLRLDDVENVVEPNAPSFSLTLPIDSMSSFEPGAVVDAIPPAKKLLELRKLVLEAERLIQNKKAFVRLVRELLLPDNHDVLDGLRTAFQPLAAELQVPQNGASPKA